MHTHYRAFDFCIYQTKPVTTLSCITLGSVAFIYEVWMKKGVALASRSTSYREVPKVRT